MLQIVQALELAIKKIKPHIIYSPSGDVNLDHQITALLLLPQDQ